MTDAEKESNRALSRERVVIEHIIAGVKRLRIVKEELRLKVAHIADDLIEIACGTHNFRTKFRAGEFTNSAPLLPELAYSG